MYRVLIQSILASPEEKLALHSLLLPLAPPPVSDSGPKPNNRIAFLLTVSTFPSILSFHSSWWLLLSHIPPAHLFHSVNRIILILLLFLLLLLVLLLLRIDVCKLICGHITNQSVDYSGNFTGAILILKTFYSSSLDLFANIYTFSSSDNGNQACYYIYV